MMKLIHLDEGKSPRRDSAFRGVDPLGGDTVSIADVGDVRQRITGMAGRSESHEGVGPSARASTRPSNVERVDGRVERER